jgi:hypothetical protein
MIRALHLYEIRLVTAIAIRCEPGKTSVDVAGGTLNRRVGAAQLKCSLRMTEGRWFPGTVRMTGEAIARQAVLQMIRILCCRIVFLVTADTLDVNPDRLCFPVAGSAC